MKTVLIVINMSTHMAITVAMTISATAAAVVIVRVFSQVPVLLVVVLVRLTYYYYNGCSYFVQHSYYRFHHQSDYSYDYYYCNCCRFR